MTMEEMHAFIQKLQNIISADRTTGSYQRALKYLNDNKYQTVRDVPAQEREAFLSAVRAAAQETPIHP